MFPSRKFSLLVAAAIGLTTLAQTMPDRGRDAASLTTREHLTKQAWWPTQETADQSQFAGTSACVKCHGGIARTQSKSQMALTMSPASDSAILTTHIGGIFKYGKYQYSIAKGAKTFAVNVSDGAQQKTDVLQWAFGSGAIAQSYVFWRDGHLYESRFNYFAPLHGFDRTPGRLQGTPISLDMAEGRKMAEFEARKCYGCHTTALTTTKPLSAAQFHPGITCEACHGPGRDHVAAIGAERSKDGLQIVNPSKLTPVESIDFCGACHGTPRDVELMGTVGKMTVRFPAYRLEKSRCWGTTGDARLTCFACHNPHRPLEQEASAYDSSCLRCHENAKHGSAREVGQKAAACPVATSRCTSCHMPKIAVPGMHHDFTDHKIRIAKANTPFPD